jgi:hypothetical protein
MARTGRWAWLPVLALLLALVPSASAHEEFTVGAYKVEVGWLYEPPVVDQPNAVTITVTDLSGGGDGAPVTDGVTLTATLALGADSKGLSLESSDDTPGEHFGAVVPTAAGDYTLHVTGTINGTAVDHTTKLETVDAPSESAFPAGHDTVGQLQERIEALHGQAWMLSGTAAALAVLALVLAVAALRRKPSA